MMQPLDLECCGEDLADLRRHQYSSGPPQHTRQSNSYRHSRSAHGMTSPQREGWPDELSSIRPETNGAALG